MFLFKDQNCLYHQGRSHVGLLWCTGTWVYQNLLVNRQYSPCNMKKFDMLLEWCNSDDSFAKSDICADVFPVFFSFLHNLLFS